MSNFRFHSSLPVVASVVASAILCAWHLPITAAPSDRVDPVAVQILPARDNGEFTLRFLNQSGTPVRLPHEIVPDGGVAANLFEVSYQGRTEAYAGPQFEPKEDDFIELQPGELLETTVGLDYLYDIERPGLHQVRFDALTAIKVLHASKDGAEPQWVSTWGKLVSNNTVVTMRCPDQSHGLGGANGEPVTGPPPTDCMPPKGPKIPNFIAWHGCSAEQKDQFQHLLTLALLQAQTSYAYFLNMPANPYRAHYWFGDPAAFPYVDNSFLARATFGEITKKLASAKIVASCDQLNSIEGHESDEAFVKTHTTNRIFLGDGFWKHPTIGAFKGPSQTSIVIHEVSHFFDVAGTQDVFGLSSYEDAHDFALSDPLWVPFTPLAYQYFAENNPSMQ